MEAKNKKNRKPKASVTEGNILSRTEALRIAEECAKMLTEQFEVKKVHLFGSVTGESPWHNRSDLDIAVEGLAPRDYFRALLALDKLLPSFLEIDLITLEDALPEIAASIQGEKKMVENPIESMKQRIANELQSLERVSEQLQQLLARMPEPPTFVELRATASILHDFYSGIERIFERIAVTLDGGLPEGERWHQSLLQQMEEDTEVRPAVIDKELIERLLEYLKFRHRFRNIYGSELRWDKLRPLAENVFDMLAQLRKRLADFEDYLQRKEGPL
ncbi:nucleotidyltransferase domain-containing protein [bacterium]|nr:nucleotidyltransferase domain-containing protein [bacterium]